MNHLTKAGIPSTIWLFACMLWEVEPHRFGLPMQFRMFMMIECELDGWLMDVREIRLSRKGALKRSSLVCASWQYLSKIFIDPIMIFIVSKLWKQCSISYKAA